MDGVKKSLPKKFLIKGQILFLSKLKMESFVEAASSGWTNDNAAFVFNLNDKFTPTNYIKAIYLVNDGFIFGGNVL